MNWGPAVPLALVLASVGLLSTQPDLAVAQRGIGANALVPAGLPAAAMPHTSRSFERMVEQTALVAQTPARALTAPAPFGDAVLRAGRRDTLDLSHVEYLDGVLAYVSTKARVPFGVELLRDVQLGDSIKARVPFAGRKLRDVLNDITRAVPGYTWREADGILLFQPDNPRQPSFLDDPVESFTFNDELFRAPWLMHRAMDPQYVVPGGFPTEWIEGLAEPGDAEWGSDQFASAAFSLTHTTMRQALTAIALHFPGASWFVIHDGTDRRYGHTRMGFGLHGWVSLQPSR